MIPGREYLPQDSDFPSIGLNVLEPSVQADPRSSPDLNNYTLVKGIPTKRLGFWALGDAFDEPVVALIEFERLSGGKDLVAITSTTQWKLDTSNDPPTWTDITALDTGDPVWTGDVSDTVQYTITTGLDDDGDLAKWLIITNGTDGPLYWDGEADTFLPYTTDVTALVTFAAISSFFNRIVVANVELSAEQAQLILWTETQKLAAYTTGVAADGAGEIIVPGVKGPFIHADTIGDRLALYSENSIALMSYTGGTQIFTVELVTDETRLVSPRAVANLGPYHVFLSQENCILFDGSRLIRTLGDRIFRKYRDELAVSRVQEAFAFHDSAKQQVFFTIPVGETGHAIYVMEYDLINIAASRWTRHEYVSQPTAMGTWSRFSSLTFDGAWATATPFDMAPSPWNQGTTRSGFPVRVVACGTQVYVADETVSADGDTAIVATWDTIDYIVPGGRLSESARFLEIEMEVKGTAMDIYYSIDSGENYVLVNAGQALDSAFKKYRFPIDVRSNKLRVRITNSELTGAIQHRWIRVWYKPGGPPQ